MCKQVLLVVEAVQRELIKKNLYFESLLLTYEMLSLFVVVLCPVC